MDQFRAHLKTLMVERNGHSVGIECHLAKIVDQLGAGLARPAPVVLSVEQETPPPPGVAPAPYDAAADSLHYVGAYAPTWFGLAVALACVYAAMLWRRYHPKR